MFLSLTVFSHRGFQTRKKAYAEKVLEIVSLGFVAVKKETSARKVFQSMKSETSNNLVSWGYILPFFSLGNDLNEMLNFNNDICVDRTMLIAGF